MTTGTNLLSYRTIDGAHALEKLFHGDADADQAWKELQTLLGTRIYDGLVSKVSSKSISEILDEELTEGRD